MFYSDNPRHTHIYNTDTAQCQWGHQPWVSEANISTKSQHHFSICWWQKVNNKDIYCFSKQIRYDLYSNNAASDALIFRQPKMNFWFRPKQFGGPKSLTKKWRLISVSPMPCWQYLYLFHAHNIDKLQQQGLTIRIAWWPRPTWKMLRTFDRIVTSPIICTFLSLANLSVRAILNHSSPRRYKRVLELEQTNTNYIKMQSWRVNTVSFVKWK